MTYSIHHFAAGFFPNTGNLSANNAYSLNVPLNQGVSDRDWVELNCFGIGHAFKSFQPNIMVIQAGGDSLYNDDHKALKVTSDGYLKVINFILKYRKPTLILGGGGYNEPATSKLWTQIVDFLSRTDRLSKECNGKCSICDVAKTITACNVRALQSCLTSFNVVCLLKQTIKNNQKNKYVCF